MGISESKKEIKGEITFILEKKNQICGELINGTVEYCVEDSETKAFIQLICVVERYFKKERLYSEESIEQCLMLSSPNQNGIIKESFSIMTPQLQSIEFRTWNQEEQIYIKYFIRSYLNFQHHNQMEKQKLKKMKEEQIFIKRIYENNIQSSIKQFSYSTKSWVLGNDQKIFLWYDFQNKNFRQNERLFFWLGVDNRNTTINIENIKAYLIFEILERELYWNIIARRILSCNNEKIKVPYGIENNFKINLNIPNNSPTAIFSKKIRMCYHVEIVFEFEYMGCGRQQYTERVLIDVVNCEN
ncbi:unnamed protein product [Paramecium sonneborni]|uniref:Uncharacterized protein n=1 Tax=Paramecium sonneborni TaxID=65129 RepID=A0A8S1PYL9_9CILI|nr:unnamed protein product [Paramecium sonneborni]